MIYFFVFLSGFAGLIYEIIWIKRAALAFGSSSLALSTVLAVFFLGLGLGSYGFGRLGRNISRPVYWCAILEFLLAVNGLLNPLVFDWAETCFSLIYNQHNLNSVALLGLRASLIAALLLPPTLLMGGTLPLFCRQLVSNENQISARIGLIYGINTLGATLGCAATGFILLPWLGVDASTYCAATVNLLAGLGFYWLSRQLKPLHSNTCKPKIPSATKTDRLQPTQNNIHWLYFGLVAGLFFLIGATALANELVWARFLTNFIRNTVYTYTITLTVVLAGTVLGSLLTASQYDKASSQSMLLLRFAILQSTSALLTLWLLHLPVNFWLYLKQFGPFPYLVLMLPPAIISGASFPLANRIVINDTSQVAHQVGLMTAFNIFGCITGSIVTGFLLLPEYGLDASIYAITGVGIFTGLLAMTAGLIKQSAVMKNQEHLLPRLLNHPIVTSLVIIISAVLWLTMPRLTSVRLPNDYIAKPESLIDFTEGYNSTLAVIKHSDANIMLVSQLWQGSSKKNHQIMVAHTPMILYPQAKSVLVIGLGVGQTASRFLDYPIQQLDVVDIEPRIFEFTRKNFASTWMDDARVRLISEDGRGYVKHTQNLYDLLSVEVGQLFRPGVDVFYTREFYREAKAHLRNTGMLMQFVPIEFLREAEFASIINTFIEQFPQSALWYNGNELLLMGFKDQAHHLTIEQFNKTLENNQIHQDLEFSHWGGASYSLNQFPVFLANFLADSADLQALANLPDTQIYQDDKPKLAYSLADFDGAEVRAMQIASIISQHLSPLKNVLQNNEMPDAELQAAEGLRQLNLGNMTAANLLEQLEAKQLESNPQGALPILNEILRANPKNLRALSLMGSALTLLGRDAEALTYLQQALSLDDRDALSNQKLGMIMVRRHQLEAAIPYLQKALTSRPDEAETLNTLAVALINLHRVSEAVEYFRRAATVEPENAVAKRNLQNAEKLLRQSTAFR